MVQVSEQQREDLALWYSSKPIYSLHVDVLTKSGFRGCITGVEQYFQGEDLSWRYQLTGMSENGPVSSWWSESDIELICRSALNIQEVKGNEVVSGRHLSGLDQVVQFVQDFGKQALEEYRDRGIMRELRISFWDVLRESLSEPESVASTEGQVGIALKEAIESDRDRPISRQQAEDAAFSDDLIRETQARSPLLHRYLKQIQDAIRGSLKAELDEDWQAVMRHDVARDLSIEGLNDYLRENPHHIENLLSKAEAHAFHKMLDTRGMLNSLDESEISDEDRDSAILDTERAYEREYGPIKGGDAEKQQAVIDWARGRLESDEVSYAGNQAIEMYGYFNDDTYWGFTIDLPDYAETGEGGPIFTVENGIVTLDNMTRSPMLMEKLEELQREFPAPEQGQR